MDHGRGRTEDAIMMGRGEPARSRGDMLEASASPLAIGNIVGLQRQLFEQCGQGEVGVHPRRRTPSCAVRSEAFLGDALHDAVRIRTSVRVVLPSTSRSRWSTISPPPRGRGAASGRR